MHRETDTRTPDQWEFDELMLSPVYGRLLEETVLQYLHEHEPLFDKHFEDHLSEDGFLISKKGDDSHSKPSIHIADRHAADQVLKLVRAKLRAPHLETELE
ncbi:MAG: hypothetical protein WC817_04425 [Patescibacteria group bacterium]|jgi:hypothetical protein